MFLTPNAKPFWGGTYFPNTARYGKPAFADLLREVERVFRENPQSVEQNRSALMARLMASARPTERVVIAAPDLDRAADQLLSLIDPVNGGIRGAPKFPQSMMLEFLWRAGERTNNNRRFAAVELTLGRICEGGIYDHLGGGFSRYSVDERWLVPHFEKMLYDNAILLELLAVAYLRSRNDLFRRRARETVAWLTRAMTTPEGASCASLDADSEGEEGKFYVWSLDEVTSALGSDEAAFFAAHYDVTAEGNFEGHNILNRLKHIPRSMEDEQRLAPLREKLLSLREKRVRPGLDDKILADWNGLMIAALVNAGIVFERPAWIEMAQNAFDFVLRHMTASDGRLSHSWRAGHARHPASVDDYANLCRAALALHEATGSEDLVARARNWVAILDGHYWDETEGGYFFAADDTAGLLARPKTAAA